MAHGHTEQDVLFRGGPLSEISTDWHPPSPAICQNRRGACHSSLYWAIVNVREVKEGERKEGGRNERKKERKEERKESEKDGPEGSPKERQRNTLDPRRYYLFYTVVRVPPWHSLDPPASAACVNLNRERLRGDSPR